MRRSRSTPVTWPRSTRTFGGLAQDGADGLGDLRRRQAGRRHLVEQRLEEMVVAPVDHGDVGIGAGEAMRGAQAAEAGADDDDVRAGHRGHHTGRRDSRRTSQRVRGPNSASVKELPAARLLASPRVG